MKITCEIEVEKAAPKVSLNMIKSKTIGLGSPNPKSIE